MPEPGIEEVVTLPKTVFITGSSRGIGLATARLFREKGFQVAATARNPKVLKDELADNLAAIACDVTSTESVQKAVAETEERFGPIDVVVNNAGYGQPGPVEEVTEEELVAQFDTNVVGVHRVIRATVPSMRERGGGCVINVSSIGGKVSTPFLGVYCASKFAVEALTDSLRLELRPFGVHVVLIEPGPITTDFGDRARQEGERFLDETRESPYSKYTTRVTRGTDMLDTFHSSPEAVAGVIYKAATSRSPRARYGVTLVATVGAVAKRVAPDSLIDFVMAKSVGL